MATSSGRRLVRASDWAMEDRTAAVTAEQMVLLTAGQMELDEALQWVVWMGMAKGVETWRRARAQTSR